MTVTEAEVQESSVSSETPPASGAPSAGHSQEPAEEESTFADCPGTRRRGVRERRPRICSYR